jgi:hypothetical protein
MKLLPPFASLCPRPLVELAAKRQAPTGSHANLLLDRQLFLPERAAAQGLTLVHFAAQLKRFL